MASKLSHLHLTAAIASAASKIEQQRQKLEQRTDMLPEDLVESELTLELMRLQRARLERHWLAFAARERGPLQ